MKFVYGFWMHSNGIVEEAWFNLGLIKTFRVTDLYMNKEGITKYNMWKLDMGNELTDKVPFVDGNKPMLIRDAADIFAVSSPDDKNNNKGKVPKHKWLSQAR